MNYDSAAHPSFIQIVFPVKGCASAGMNSQPSLGEGHIYPEKLPFYHRADK